MKSSSRTFGAVARLLSMTAVAGMLGACASETGGGELPRPRHLVLVTLDTTRADHLSALGYDLETSPWLAELAQEGISFGRAYAQSATTKPSHATLFTSLYPLQHGVQNNALVLEDRFVTMAEVLAAAGFQTAAFVSADAPLGGNLRQGFEVWDEPDGEDLTNDKGGKAYRSAGVTIDRAIEWLQSAHSAHEELFLWVHVYDAHKPLDPPEGPRQRIAELVQRRGEDAHKATLEAQGIPATSHDGWYKQTLEYDAEILHADSQLRRLFEHMDAAGLTDEALWIVAADHGEGLGSHGRWGHSVHVYNAQLHVPLVFWFGGGAVAAGSIDDAVVELTDVLPTVVEIFQLVAVDQILPMQGRSLVPYLRGSRPRQRRVFAYSERSRYLGTRQRTAKGNYEAGSRYAFQDLEYKYLLFTEGPDELYDLRTDPAERVDLIDDPAHGDVRDQLKDLLAELVATTETGATPASVSEAEVERLRALGYIQ